MIEVSEFPDRPTFASGAYTLDPGYLGENSSGWTLVGEVREDYYQWINKFTAYHKELGVVFGDFEHTVTASSQEALDHFMKHHPPQAWDYHDI